MRQSMPTSKIIASRIKLVCSNSDCERSIKFTYRIYDSTKDFICSLCGSGLKRHSDQNKQKRLDKAKKNYEEINHNCNSI